MLFEEPIIITAETRQVEPVSSPQLHNQVELATPTPEQIAAANGLFAQHRETQQIANLVGLWSSTLLMHHLAVETFDTSEEEEEEEKQRPGPSEK